VKLYNHTKIEDRILLEILRQAAKAVGGIRTKNVIIKVTTASRYTTGLVESHRYGFFYEGWLEGSGGYRDEDGDWHWNNPKPIRTDGGIMYLKIACGPQGFHYWDPLKLAERIFKLVSHEWRHIRDIQKNQRFGEYNRNWKNRPHEKRAIKSAQVAAMKAEKQDNIQEAILNLGIKLEKLFKAYKEQWDKKWKQYR